MTTLPISYKGENTAVIQRLYRVPTFKTTALFNHTKYFNQSVECQSLAGGKRNSLSQCPPNRDNRHSTNWLATNQQQTQRYSNTYDTKVGTENSNSRKKKHFYCVYLLFIIAIIYNYSNFVTSFNPICPGGVAVGVAGIVHVASVARQGSLLPPS